jgi:RNA polymerase sigma factor (sigma-70 family)
MNSMQELPPNQIQPPRGMPDLHSAWSDEALIRLMQSTGDERAFHMIYVRYRMDILNQARTLVSDADACDVSQRVFVYFWKKIPDLRAPYNVKALLLKAVRNRCMDILRRQQRWQFCDAAELDLAATDPIAEQRPNAAAIWAQVQAAVTRGQFRILWLHFAKGLRQAEIAEREGISVGAVKKRKHDAIKKLRTIKLLRDPSTVSSAWNLEEPMVAGDGTARARNQKNPAEAAAPGANHNRAFA